MPITEIIALVLDSQYIPYESELDTWDALVKPWKDRLSYLYQENKRKHDFTSSSRLARTQVVREILEAHLFYNAASTTTPVVSRLTN